MVKNDSDCTTRQWEAVEQGLNCKDKRIIQNASLKNEEKRSCNLDVAKVATFPHCNSFECIIIQMSPQRLKKFSFFERLEMHLFAGCGAGHTSAIFRFFVFLSL